MRNIKRIIREELDDLSWMDEVTSEYQPRKGDNIEVINNGTHESYMAQLGGYRDDFENGYYGKIITGTIIQVSSGYDIPRPNFTLNVESQRYSFTDTKYTNHINFPISGTDPRTGLKLKYTPLQ